MDATKHVQQFKEKLEKMTNTQQSIQAISLWTIYHIKHHLKTVEVWREEILKAKPERYIVFMYLCNDIIQSSRKKSSSFTNAFQDILVDVVNFIEP